MAGSLSVLCGQMLVVGLAGPAPTIASGHRVELDVGEPSVRAVLAALAAGERGGVVLFKRNVGPGAEGLAGVRALNALLRETCPADLPPLIAVDQEGGRVMRLGPPAMQLPPMRRLADVDPSPTADLVRRIAEAQARELAALGFTMSFAPVADIHTRDENPIIGDRAFATTPDGVARLAGAWAEGLAASRVLSCAKHFPGHGDTTVDSHLALPHVDRARHDLERIEIASFRALAKNPAVDSMMTAHVVYPALDPEQPATLSHAICTDLLRGELGFPGVLFSDDLEMKALDMPPGEAAVRAVNAGCDVLLVCSRADLAEVAHETLVHEAEKSTAFRARCEEAFARSIAMRRRVPPAPVASDAELARIYEATAPVSAELAERLADRAAKDAAR